MVGFMASLVELSHKYIVFRKRAAAKGDKLRVFTRPLRIADLGANRSEWRLGARSSRSAIIFNRTRTVETDVDFGDQS